MTTWAKIVSCVKKSRILYSGGFINYSIKYNIGKIWGQISQVLHKTSGRKQRAQKDSGHCVCLAALLQHINAAEAKHRDALGSSSKINKNESMDFVQTFC